MTLFVRHTRGLTLTEDGQRVLEMVRPLLALQDKTYIALSQLAQMEVQPLHLGLSTAFEQGVFVALESTLNARVKMLRVMRHGSPELVRQVRRGKLDAALVALPIEASGLTVTPLAWQEPIIAALPSFGQRLVRLLFPYRHSTTDRCSGSSGNVTRLSLTIPGRFSTALVTLLPVLKNHWSMMCCLRGLPRAMV